MNQTQSYMDMHAGSHMSSGPSYSHSATANTLPHYPQYPQPPVMPPASSHYAPPQSYNYGYANGMASPQSATGPGGPQVQPQGIQLPAMLAGPNGQHPYVPANSTPTQAYPTATQQPFDTTGQIAPPGMKPRVTATLWEDEGSLCFQVEAKGVCVARREDNHFINGTKLLNVAGMTRGRRDGILKSEKTRHVVKIGPMHLKGVWIPFERALDFANKEKITDLLYPLFVHNIGGLLYNPENAPRTNAVVAATERRRMDSVDSNRQGQPAPTPSLHHHHSMQSAGGGAPPTPHSIAPHPNSGRPGLDRAHTFPTPPTSASSVMGMGNQGSSYEWGGQNIPNGVAASQPLSIDTGMNARSMPTTPATTPPGASGQGMQQYQNQQGYESKPYYSTTPGSQNGYAQHPDSARYGQPMSSAAFGKGDMGPPTAPGSSTTGSDPHEQKPDAYSQVPGQGHPGEHDGGDHHENGYMHSNAAAYGGNRAQYAYNPVSEHLHSSPEMTGSPSHPNSSRGTPRTMPSNQQQWPQDYQTPPRPAASSNVYNVMGNSRSSNGTNSSDNYASSAYSSTSHTTGMTSVKRGRDDDDQDRPSSRDFDHFGAKRQKSGRQEFGMPLSAPPHMQAIKTGGQR